MAFAKGTVSLEQAGTDVFLASLNIPDLCPFITGVASFRYEIDISLPLVGVRRNRRTIRSVSSQSTTVTLALVCHGDLKCCLDKQHVLLLLLASNRATL